MSPDDAGTATATPGTETSESPDGLLAGARQAAQSAAAATPTPDPVIGQRPADIPENFWDATKGAPRVDEIVKSWKSITADRDRLKQQQAQAADPAPETADKYLDTLKFKDGVLELADDAKNWGEIRNDDPLLKGFAETCLEEGIGQKKFEALLPKLLSKLAPKLPPPVDPAAELKILDDGIEGRGQQMVDSIANYISRQIAHGELSQEEGALIDSMCRDAFGIRTFAKIIKMNGLQPIPISPNSISNTSMSKDEWKAAVAAKDANGKSRYFHDEAYRNHMDAIGKKLFPEG